MTISSQVKQTLASLKNIEASLTAFSNLSTHEKTKQVFQENAQTAHHLVETMKNRVKELEMEEPQYKGL
ncbi:MAG TPA: DUF1657 domain-containing protein [Bacillota bacterium]|nr:DUF1657 domain-containing protein [Bacillota bacterium]